MELDLFNALDDEKTKTSAAELANRTGADEILIGTYAEPENF